MKNFRKHLISKNIVQKNTSLFFELGCSAYRFLVNIWAANNFMGIVISEKILSLKFMPYIAVKHNPK
jgi:hypothetical protein